MAMELVYVPIIKGKANDMKAVGRMPADARASMKPLVEVLPYLKGGIVDEYLAKVVKYITTHLGDGPVFVDVYGFQPTQKTADGASAILAGYHWITDSGRRFTPTYGLARDDTLWDPLKKVVAANGEGFCFRLERDDLGDVSEDSWAEIIQRSGQLGLNAGIVDLMIDLKDVRALDISEVKELIVDFLALNPKASSYRSVIVVGSSALPDVATVEKEGHAVVMRNELLLWSLLKRDIHEGIRLLFGDYGVVHPKFSGIGGAFLNMNAKIRYTAGAHIHYFRGHGLLRPKKDFLQYHSLAKKVVGHPKFRGGNSSFGDAYLADCANYVGSTGNAGTWVLADQNQHITYTARQMSVLPNAVMSASDESQVMNVLEGT